MTAAIPAAPSYEGSRALAPRSEGYVERDGVRTFYELYGDGRTTILFLPSWSIVHSRVWRAQIAYFARHFRVVVFDPRGNGKSDRPLAASAYEPQELALDAVAVMDATGTASALTVSLSMGTAWSLVLAAFAPERIAGAVFVGPTPYGVAEPYPAWSLVPFNERLESYEGFRGQNRYFIRDHYPQFVRFWAATCNPEPHSTRAIEFGIGMAMETTPEVVLATLDAAEMADFESSAARLAVAGRELRPLARGLQAPALVISGELDIVAPPHWARALAEDARGEFVVVPGAGHVPQARRPVAFNRAVRTFAERVAMPR